MFLTFKTDISHIGLPDRFTFPFYYEPHPLTKIAAEELQSYLKQEINIPQGEKIEDVTAWFAPGKMFGVLVVENNEGNVGYLSAYSGKKPIWIDHTIFVPPVYDVHDPHSFFAKGEQELNALNRAIELLENDPDYLAQRQRVQDLAQRLEDSLAAARQQLKHTKKDRKERRLAAAENMTPEAFEAFNQSLAEESIRGQLDYKKQKIQLHEALQSAKDQLAVYTQKIADKKAYRKSLSAQLQKDIFESYQFLNQDQSIKTLTDIFPNYQDQKPPSGAGECTAPKLLQYAFQHDLKPIAMGEFWWGKSPSTEIRKHGYFYPACNSRCKPILKHMLSGIKLEENPFVINPAEGKSLEIVHNEEHFLVINKPAEFLSVPGKVIQDSVYQRIQQLYPEAEGPLIVHRLDMSTSGLMVIAKNKRSHQKLQEQFIKRTVKKRYVALLDGLIESDAGFIDLPLRVDLDDRPRQMVCYDYGKKAVTKWKVVERKDHKTRIHLYPITGRTHQLRVHMSHPLGLNTPIAGDDLYGKKSDRLHLHAAYLQFDHPITGERVSFHIPEPF